MITSNNKIILYSGALLTYTTPDIYVRATNLDDAGAVIQCRLTLFAAGTTTYFLGEHVVELSATTVDAETGTGSGEFSTYFDAVQRAVKTYLVALNGGVTFTIV